MTCKDGRTTTAFPRRLAQKYPKHFRDWNKEFKRFRKQQGGNPFIRLQLLYALPPELQDHLQREVPDLLEPAELAFEQKLAGVCGQHHAIGIFYGRPVLHSSFNKPALRLLSGKLLGKLR